mgnify:CR=1 FL=1
MWVSQKSRPRVCGAASLLALFIIRLAVVVVVVVVCWPNIYTMNGTINWPSRWIIYRTNNWDDNNNKHETVPIIWTHTCASFCFCPSTHTHTHTHISLLTLAIDIPSAFHAWVARSLAHESHSIERPLHLLAWCNFCSLFFLILLLFCCKSIRWERL